MYILPTLTYLEVVVPADASKFFIFEHFKWVVGLERHRRRTDGADGNGR